MTRWHWSVWVRGLVAALISGAATGVAAVVVAPELQSRVLVKMAAISAAVGVAAYLKQSPLPAEDEPPPKAAP